MFLNYCVSLLWKNWNVRWITKRPCQWLFFRERSKSRFCIGPGKRPFTEILSRDGAYHEKQKNKPANHACSSAKSLWISKWKLQRLLVIRLKVNSSFPFICRVNLKSSLPCNRRLRIDIDINVVIIQRCIFVLLYSRVLLTFSVPRIIIWLNAWIVIILLCLRRIFVCFISGVIKLTRCWCRRRLWFPRLSSLVPKDQTHKNCNW